MDRRTTSRPQRVLLVDDSDVVREMWRAWLTFWGFVVEEARYAAEAVEKARTRLPDLIDRISRCRCGTAARQSRFSPAILLPLKCQSWPAARKGMPSFRTPARELRGLSRNRRTR